MPNEELVDTISNLNIFPRLCYAHLMILNIKIYLSNDDDDRLAETVENLRLADILKLFLCLIYNHRKNRAFVK